MESLILCSWEALKKTGPSGHLPGLDGVFRNAVRVIREWMTDWNIRKNNVLEF